MFLGALRGSALGLNARGADEVAGVAGCAPQHQHCQPAEGQAAPWGLAAALGRNVKLPSPAERAGCYEENLLPQLGKVAMQTCLKEQRL